MKTANLLLANNVLMVENTHLKSELQAVRELLKTIEWTDMEQVQCPCCYNYYKEGHKQGCWLKAELDKLEGK